MRVYHPYHQGWTIDLIAWPVERPNKWATRFKRATLFLIRRLAPAFNGGSDPFFVHRTPNDLSAVSSRIIGLSDADESDDRGPRFTDPYSDALKQSARSIEERSEDAACYMPRC